MTIEERALVSMYTRSLEARELIQTDLRMLEFIKDEDNQVLRILAQADDSLQSLASALSIKVSRHTESTHLDQVRGLSSLRDP